MNSELSPHQEEQLKRFEIWLMETQIGYKVDGNAIPMRRPFDEKTMLMYHIERFNRVFIVELTDIPPQFLSSIR